MNSHDPKPGSPQVPDARRGNLLRFSAVAFSIVLVAGYVLYRSGAGRVGTDEGSSTAGQAADPPGVAERRHLLPGSKSNKLDEDLANVLYADTPTTLPANPFRQVLPGSKIGIVLRSDEMRPPPSNPATLPSEFSSFAGSKSGIIVRPGDLHPPATAPAETSRDER